MIYSFKKSNPLFHLDIKMTKNKNYTKNGNKGCQKHPDKYSLGRTLFKSRFGTDAREVGDKEKWVRYHFFVHILC